MITVSTETELRALRDAGFSGEIALVDINEQLRAAADAATRAERERIAGLQQISQPGFEAEIAAAIASGATIADTAIAIARIVNDRGVSLASLRADAPQVVGHGGTRRDESSANPWKRVVSKMNRGQESQS